MVILLKIVMLGTREELKDVINVEDKDTLQENVLKMLNVTNVERLGIWPEIADLMMIKFNAITVKGLDIWQEIVEIEVEVEVEGEDNGK